MTAPSPPAVARLRSVGGGARRSGLSRSAAALLLSVGATLAGAPWSGGGEVGEPSTSATAERGGAERASGWQAAEIALLHQRASGGWPKHDDRSRLPGPEAQRELQAAGERADATLDNGATHGEIGLLAAASRASGEARYAAAAARGIRYLLAAQYPNGGWPQTFPHPRGYSRQITFNDGAMIGALETLHDAARSAMEYAFLDDSDRDACRAAVQRGVACILKCQVVVAGVPTVGCAQHDVASLAPCGARSYELPSLSGLESAGVVRFLMRQPDQGPAVRTAIEQALQWFERSQVKGVRLDRVAAPELPGGFDLAATPDPQAPPLWARFYDLETNQPIFCDRDGVPRPSLADLSHERRTRYSWLGPYARQLLDVEAPRWRAAAAIGAGEPRGAPTRAPRARG